jgi:hypothetical protein
MSGTQEMVLKQKTVLGLKVIMLLKVTAMESALINVAPPTWLASCQCSLPDRTPRGYPRDAFGQDDVVDRDLMVRAVAQQEKHTGLYRFGPREWRNVSVRYPTAHHRVTHVMLLGRTTSLIAA